MKRELQSSPAPAQQSHRDDDVARQPLQVGDTLPARLFSDDLMRIFNIRKTQFYRLLEAGKFDRFEIRPRIGRRTWSGKLVMAYLNGEAGSSRFSLVKTGTR